MTLFAYDFRLVDWPLVVPAVMFVAAALSCRNRDPDFFRRLLRRDGTARGVGLYVLVAGTLFAYKFAYQPIRAALDRQPTVEYSSLAVGAAGVFVYFATTLLVAGRHAHRVVPPRQQWGTPPQQAFIWGGVAVFFGLYFGFQLWMQHLGYTAKSRW